MYFWSVTALAQVALFCFANGQTVPPSEVQAASAFLDDFNARFEELLYQASVSQWNYYTNITDHNWELSVSVFQSFTSMYAQHCSWSIYISSCLQK